jgi:hypothetical protein
VVLVFPAGHIKTDFADHGSATPTSMQSIRVRSTPLAVEFATQIELRGMTASFASPRPA